MAEIDTARMIMQAIYTVASASDQANGATVKWRGLYLVGSIEQLFPEEHPAIVSLNRASRTYSREFYDAMRQVKDIPWLYLTADPVLDLEGQLHVVQKNGNYLRTLNSEQLAFANLQMQLLAALDPHRQTVIVPYSRSGRIRPENTN